MTWGEFFCYLGIVIVIFYFCAFYVNLFGETFKGTIFEKFLPF